MPVPFIKMHGLGNDFVILDARKTGVKLTPQQIRRVADRRRGVGCDQVIQLEEPKNSGARLFMRIYNIDGSEAEACGNATRCVARLETDAGAPPSFNIETLAGLLAVKVGDATVTVDMGEMRFGWKDIPLAHEADTLNMHIGEEFGLPPAVAMNIGNPHAVFFLPDAEKVEVAKLGPIIEHHAMFPAKTNVCFASINSRKSIRMRVWERGSGITEACGSAASATMAAAVRRGLTERRAEVVLDGGPLTFEWLQNGHILMEGPTSYSFSGQLDDLLKDGA